MAITPKQIAQPRPKPPEPPRLLPGQVLSRKHQEHYVDDAHALAEDLGWQGDEDNELHDVRVADAKAYLVKVFHETHQASLNEHLTAPTAEAVCEHLGITDPAEVAHVTATLADLAKREAEELPQNAATASLTPPPKVVGMAATLEGDVSSLMRGGVINPPTKAKG